MLTSLLFRREEWTFRKLVRQFVEATPCGDGEFISVQGEAWIFRKLVRQFVEATLCGDGALITRPG